MKNIILNLLTISGLVAFFLFATATSQEESFGDYDMDIRRVVGGVEVVNLDDFDYVDLSIFMNYSDTISSNQGQEPEITFKTFSYDDSTLEIKINERTFIPFRDFKANTPGNILDTLRRINVNVNGACPDNDVCGYSEFIN